MSQSALCPLRFEPIYQYRLWGGRRLAGLLSDRDDHPSRVAEGPLKGRAIAQLLEQFPERAMGTLAGRFSRFPLLLKFLDLREMLSVQVHPGGETGKTEASPFSVGAPGVPTVLVCIEGAGQIENGGATYAAGKGDVLLLPAVLGACMFQPRGAVEALEIGIPG